MKKRIKKRDFLDKENYNNNYNSMHERIVDYLSSGKMHSTLVGIIINLDGDKGKKDVLEATRFADYFIDFLKKIDLEE